MPYRIRKTAFSWNPEHESRGDAWERIKDHIQAEFERITEVDRQRRKAAQRQALPTYARNQAIFHDVTVAGLDERQVARTYGLPLIRVRDILRSVRGQRERLLRTFRPPPPPVYQPPSRRVPELPEGQPQTTAMLVDP
jgi:hypothetical protein